MIARIALCILAGTLFFTAGCGENPLVGEVQALRNEMCACANQDCADAILKKLKDFDKENKGKKVSRQDNDKMQKLYVEVSDCLGKVILKDREAAQAATQPPKPTPAPSPETKKEESEAVEKQATEKDESTEETPEEPPKAEDAPE